MEGDKRVRLTILFLAVFIGVALMSIPLLSIYAGSSGTITVCQAGPPECDHQTIQAGIDAASAGDTVIVSPGVYTEQLTLKSGIVLESSGGPDVTAITAAEGPVVFVNNVTSATLMGFAISGQGVLTEPVGIDLYDSSLTLIDCVISDFYGADGGQAQPDGEDAIAISFAGAGNLKIVSSVIQDIAGGGGLYWGVYDTFGGDAFGVWADGEGEVVITGTIIRRLTGGDAGDAGYFACSSEGGHAVGVNIEGEATLTVDNTDFTNLVGGFGCGWCGNNAGAAIGVQATGGTVVLRDNLFTSFFTRPGNTVPSYAIHTSQTAGTYVERNTIASFPDAFSAKEGTHNLWPQSPWCVPLPAKVTAIASEEDVLLHVKDNSLTDLFGRPTGVRAQYVTDVRLTGNSFTRLTGDYASSSATGISVVGADTVEIVANALDVIHGGDGYPQTYYLSWGVGGGSAVGIKLIACGEARVVNNTVQSLAGGDGGDCIEDCQGPGGRGGDAISLSVAEGAADVWNNVFYQAVAGLGGESDGLPGQAAGLRLTGEADVAVANNVLVSQTFGVLSTIQVNPIWGYNALWGNETDYVGVSPGVGDLHVAPGFVDADNGDFHLVPDSPLVDAGTNIGMPGSDFDGQPRPMDGDGDGVSVADIGVDEYWAGDLLAAMTVDRSTAAPGDVLTYQVVLINPGAFQDFANVILTDVMPSRVTYVTGTLTGTAGAYNYSDGVITWTGAVVAGDAVTIAFSARVDNDLVGPHALVNEALVDDRTGVSRTLHTITMINPLKYYFPLFLFEGVFW